MYDYNNKFDYQHFRITILIPLFGDFFLLFLCFFFALSGRIVALADVLQSFRSSRRRSQLKSRRGRQNTVYIICYQLPAALSLRQWVRAWAWMIVCCDLALLSRCLTSPARVVGPVSFYLIDLISFKCIWWFLPVRLCASITVFGRNVVALSVDLSVTVKLIVHFFLYFVFALISHSLCSKTY